MKQKKEKEILKQKICELNNELNNNKRHFEEKINCLEKNLEEVNLKHKKDLENYNKQQTNQINNIINDLEILKQKLQLNEYSLNNLKNTINIENKVDNGGDMLETVKIIQEKNEEIRKLGEKVKELETNTP